MAASPKACRDRPEDLEKKSKAIVMKISLSPDIERLGALIARALAKAGHTVYPACATLPGRCAEVEEVKKFAKNKVDLRSIELDVTSQAPSTLRFRRLSVKNKRLDVVTTMPAIWSWPSRGLHAGALAEYMTSMCSARERVNRAACSLRKPKNGLLVWVSQQQFAEEFRVLAPLRREGGHGCPKPWSTRES